MNHHDPPVPCLGLPGFAPPESTSPAVLLQDELYSDNELSRLWLEMEAGKGYEAHWDTMPLAEAAEAIARKLRGTGPGPLEVFALGPGGARREVALVQKILSRLDLAAVRLYLFELSHAGAWAAHRSATEAFAGDPRVHALGLQGDLRRLCDHQQLLFRPAGVVRPRLVTMFGGTFGNFDDERAVAASLHAALSPGDLFCFDVCLHPGGAADDPRLQTTTLTPASAPALWTWMEAVLCRTRDAVLERLEVRVRAPLAVPESYAVEYWGVAEGGEAFRLARMGRYDLAPLLTALKGLGFVPVTHWDFGAPYPRALVLVERAEA